MRRFLRKLRHVFCLVRGGHALYHPVAHTDTLIAYCQRCGFVSVLSLSDLPRPIPFAEKARRSA